MTKSIWTIGYQGATMPAFLDVLKKAGVDIVVDVRAVVSSRRPGFSKNALAAHLDEVGIGYLHLRGLGTPADGRAAAKSGKFDELRRIYSKTLKTDAAKEDLETLAGMVRTGKHVCLLCFEADAAHCHRSMVVEALTKKLPVKAKNLSVVSEE
ncbi:MAG TPA: DUF488 domain-containing protein [Gemmatimonadaceae bacterium]